MPTQLPRTLRSVRYMLVAIGFLLSISLFGAGPAAANVLNPAVDVGAPGGGGSGFSATGEDDMDLLASCLCMTAS